MVRLSIIIVGLVLTISFLMIYIIPKFITPEEKLPESILKLKAIEKRDKSYCNKMEEGYEKWDCYSKLALLTKNPSLCNEIPGSVKAINLGGEENIFMRGTCSYMVNSILAQNPQACDDSKKIDTWICYWNYAIVLKLPSYCGKTLWNVINECYTNVGVLTKNVTVCDGIKTIEEGAIPNEDLFNQCKGEILIDPSICTSRLFLRKETCYMFKAITDKNVSICESLRPSPESHGSSVDELNKFIENCKLYVNYTIPIDVLVLDTLIT
jgi:hypothetical protein